jgi:hypothetical protein
MWAEREREVVSLISRTYNEENENARTQQPVFYPFFCFYARKLVGLFHGERKTSKRDICFGFLLPPEKLLLAAAAVFKEEEKKRIRRQHNGEKERKKRELTSGTANGLKRIALGDGTMAWRVHIIPVPR